MVELRYVRVYALVGNDKLKNEYTMKAQRTMITTREKESWLQNESDKNFLLAEEFEYTMRNIRYGWIEFE